MHVLFVYKDTNYSAGWSDCLSLTHWGRVTHICVDKLTSIASDNGLSPGWRQAIIWTNAGILLIGSLGTNFSEFLIAILTFSFKKMRLKVASAKWRPFCLGLNELPDQGFDNENMLYGKTQCKIYLWYICVHVTVILLGFCQDRIFVLTKENVVGHNGKPLGQIG